MRYAPLFALALGFVLGQLLQVPTVAADSPRLEVSGSCSRGEILVYEGSGKASCAELRELKFPRCQDGEFLTATSSGLACVGPSSTPWGAKGLLPECSTGDIVVSEGFGRWKCHDPKKKK